MTENRNQRKEATGSDEGKSYRIGFTGGNGETGGKRLQIAFSVPSVSSCKKTDATYFLYQVPSSRRNQPTASGRPASCFAKDFPTVAAVPPVRVAVSAKSSSRSLFSAATTAAASPPGFLTSTKPWLFSDRKSV